MSIIDSLFNFPRKIKEPQKPNKKEKTTFDWAIHNRF